MAARAHQHRRGDRVVDDPSVAAALDGPDVFARAHAAGTVDQVRVELATADRVADRPLVVDVAHRRVADHANPKSGDRLQCAVAAVLVDVQPQLVHDVWRDPAGAHLVARKARLVDQHDVEPVTAQVASARGPGGASADDYDVARVHGTFMLPLRAKTTWNSCIHPEANAACDPARYSRQARTNRSSNIDVTVPSAASKRDRQ